MPPDELISCRLNSLLGGDGCETFCSRVWVCSLSNWKGRVIMYALDTLFAWRESEHCWQAHLRHLRRSLRGDSHEHVRHEMRVASLS